MSGCDREQGTHFQCDCLREKTEELQEENAELRNRVAILEGTGERVLQGLGNFPFDPVLHAAVNELRDALPEQETQSKEDEK